MPASGQGLIGGGRRTFFSIHHAEPGFRRVIFHSCLRNFRRHRRHGLGVRPLRGAHEISRSNVAASAVAWSSARVACHMPRGSATSSNQGSGWHPPCR